MGRSKALLLMQNLTGTSWPHGSQNLSASITEQGVEGGCGAERYEPKNPHKKGLNVGLGFGNSNLGTVWRRNRIGWAAREEEEASLQGGHGGWQESGQEEDSEMR